MTTSLTVSSPRHLALPECAPFAPTELRIGADCSKDDFARIAKALAAIDTADGLWVADLAAFAEDHWQADGLALAREATSLSVHFLKRSARVARYFPPQHRFPNYKFVHYRALLPFPQEAARTILEKYAEHRRLSANALRALAVEEYEEPVKACKQPQKHSLQIRETIWARLAQHATSKKIALLVELILDEWLKKPESEQTIILASVKLQRDHKAERARERAAEKAAARDKREAEALRQKEEREAFYAAERRKRLAERAAHKAEVAAAKEKHRAEKIAARAKKETIRGIEFSMFESCEIGKSTKFRTLDEAQEAAARYSSAKGYPFEGFKCDKCPAFHIRCDEVAFEAARERARQRARERALGTCPSDDRATDHATTRPTYAERRAAQKTT
jgi:hypothetical protein